MDFLGFFDRQNKDGRVALTICAGKGALPILQLLPDHGANYALGGGAGNNPLHWSLVLQAPMIKSTPF